MSAFVRPGDPSTTLLEPSGGFCQSPSHREVAGNEIQFEENGGKRVKIREGAIEMSAIDLFLENSAQKRRKYQHFTKQPCYVKSKLSRLTQSSDFPVDFPTFDG